MFEWWRRAVDRALHAGRRRAARAALAARPRPGFVLFVCHGNLCRSPFAAAAFAGRPEAAGIAVDSAGLLGNGRPAPAAAIAVAARRDVDLATHHSQLVRGDLLAAADLVVVMDGVQRSALVERLGCPGDRVVVLGDFDPWPITDRAILDPITRPEPVFDAVYARIERCVAALAAALPPRRA